MIRKIKNNDISNLCLFLQARDPSKTMKEILRLAKDCITSRKLAYIIDNEVDITGLILVEKEDDKYYLTIESSSKNDCNHLLSVLFWDFHKDLYARIKKTNKVGFLLKKHKFKIIEKNDDGFVMFYSPKWKDNRYANKRRVT